MRAQRAGRRIGSFDRTYEGLKLCTNAALVTIPAFDRTYEGLKHGIALRYVAVRFAF